jgi:MFS family permease
MYLHELRAQHWRPLRSSPGSNGANLGFPEALGIPTSTSAPNHIRNEWIVGVVNAAPYLACVGFSCWISDPLNNWLGRRGVIFFCGIFCTLSVIGSAFSQTWQQLCTSCLS